MSKPPKHHQTGADSCACGGVWPCAVVLRKNIRHSSENPRWGTSLSIVEIARVVLGLHAQGATIPITVDPFSEPYFNRNVRAARILTGEPGLDGYKDRWLVRDPAVCVSAELFGDSCEALDGCPRADQLLAGFAFNAVTVQATALVNPPGDDSGDNVQNAWRLAYRYWALGWLGGGVVWVAFNMNQMQTLQGVARDCTSPLSGPFVRCVPSRRQPFEPREGVAAEAPTHPCWFLLMPSHHPIVAAQQREVFVKMGSALGDVW